MKGRPPLYADGSARRNLVLDAEVTAKAEEAARREGKSLSQWVNETIKRRMDNENAFANRNTDTDNQARCMDCTSAR